MQAAEIYSFEDISKHLQTESSIESITTLKTGCDFIALFLNDNNNDDDEQQQQNQKEKQQLFFDFLPQIRSLVVFRQFEFSPQVRDLSAHVLTTKILPCCHSLVRLEIQETDFGNDLIKTICDALRLHCGNHLEELDLRANQISERGCEYVAEFLDSFHSSSLPIMTKLKILILNENEIGDDGIRRLCVGLKKNTTLEYLDVGFCLVGDLGCAYLVDYFACSSKLKTLVICFNEITDEGVCRLCIDGLKHNSTLQSLNLGRNKFGMRGLLALAEYLAHDMCNLSHLNLSDNKINDEAFCVFCSDGLKRNNSIISLDLTNNNSLTFDAGLKLCEFLDSPNCALKSISLDFKAKIFNRPSSVDFFVNRVKENRTLISAKGCVDKKIIGPFLERNQAILRERRAGYLKLVGFLARLGD